MPNQTQGTELQGTYSLVEETQTCCCDVVSSRVEIQLGHCQGIWRHNDFCLLGEEGEMNRLMTHGRERRVGENSWLR